MGHPRRQEGDSRQSLTLDGLLGFLPRLGDVTEDDRPSDKLPVRVLGLVAHQRRDIEIQEASPRVKDLQIAAHDVSGVRHGSQIKAGNRLAESTPEVFGRVHSEEGARRLVQVDDPVLRISHDDPLQQNVEDGLEKALLMGEGLQVLADVTRFDESDPLDKLVDESPVHQERSSSSSATLREKRARAASTGSGEHMSTPASARVSIGNLLPPLFRKPK